MSNIPWTYLDKTNATVKALKDYSKMQHIIDFTDDEIRQVEEQMAGVGSMKIDGMPRNPDPQAGEERMITGMKQIDVLRERLRQANEYMRWFLPGWNALSEDDRFILDTYYSKDNEYGSNAVDTVSDHFGIERSSAYRRKNRALENLTTLLYGR
jgi:hypothetical protein